MPVKVANDADVQGCAVARGDGFELVITLGTGVGTALFSSGVLLPHLELGHAQFRKGETFEEQLGNLARKEVGVERWSARRAQGARRRTTGSSSTTTSTWAAGTPSTSTRPTLPAKATIVPNTAGILGGRTAVGHGPAHLTARSAADPWNIVRDSTIVLT